MKIAIIGGGPAGYTAAIRAAKQGFETVLIEKDHLGGTCLNYGCIPTKSILASANLVQEIKESKELAINSTYYFEYSNIVKRKNKIVEELRSGLDFLISSNKIDLKKGSAEIINKNTIKVNEEEIKTDIIILATGSKQKDMGVKGIFPEQVFLEENLFDKNKEINILGAGFIGCELATIFSSLDFRVNLFEREQKILPFLEEEVSNLVERNLIKQGVKVSKSYFIEKERETEKDFIVCCGRQANIPKSEVFIEEKEDFIKVDENLKTNTENIYAIGDVNGNCLLANYAVFEGEKVIENIIGNFKKVDLNSCPKIIFTKPEIAFFGEFNSNYKSVKSYFKTNSKALAESATEGFVKLFVDQENIIKAGLIVGKYASEMINQLAFFYGENTNKLKDKLFFHPSFSESILNLLEKLK